MINNPTQSGVAITARTQGSAIGTGSGILRSTRGGLGELAPAREWDAGLGREQLGDFVDIPVIRQGTSKGHSLAQPAN